MASHHRTVNKRLVTLYVGNPQPVRAVGPEAAVDQIRGTGSVVVRDGGGAPLLASDHTHQAFLAHQPLHRTAIATATPSRWSWRHTLRAPYTPKLVSHTRRIWSLSASSRRDRADRRSGSRSRRFASQIGRRGDRQHRAQNSFDPISVPVLVHAGGHLRPPRSNTSAWAKYAEAFPKISFARHNTRTSRRNSTNSVCSSEVNPGRPPDPA